MRFGFDSSRPPTDIELGMLSKHRATVAAGYVGGTTPRVWTPDEWRRVAFDMPILIPIYVAPDDHAGHEDGALHGNLAIQALQAAGLGGCVWLDLEGDFLFDPEWIYGFRDACDVGNVSVGQYGTEITLSIAPEGRAGAWIAHWATYDWLSLPGDTLGWQYSSSNPFDWSVWDDRTPSAELVS